MYNLENLEYQNRTVLLTSQLARIYETDVNDIMDNFKKYEQRFVKEKDYYLLEESEKEKFKCKYPDLVLVLKDEKLYLWTERGFLKYSFILDTDKAWEVFDMLIDIYFEAEENGQVSNSSIELFFDK